MTSQNDNRRATALPLRGILAALAITLVATDCAPVARLTLPSDQLLHLDWIEWQDLFTSRVVQVPPGRPVILAGADGALGTADDTVVPGIVGDLDLVIRAGVTEIHGEIPAAAAGAVSEPSANGLGSEIDFVVTAVAGWVADPLSAPVFSPSIEGNPLLVAAFADLDSDGRIGPTNADGDPLDLEVEEAELDPVAMQMVFVSGGRATGRLRLLAGGPTANPLRIVLAAAVYSGETQPDFFGGVVPFGPLLMTAVPFFPAFDPAEMIEGGAGVNGPEPVDPGRPIGMELVPEFDADPNDPTWGEAFALRVDGSEASIDVVDAFSGETSRIGIALSARHPNYLQMNRRVVRPGLDANGNPHPYEIAERIYIADDGPASTVEARLVPLDALGSITDLSQMHLVKLSTGGVVEILSPDLDGDPYSENVVLSTASLGTPIVLGDGGGIFDDPLSDTLVIDSAFGGAIVELVLPDPDVNDSGVTDTSDLQEVLQMRGVRLGDLAFDARYDVDGNGRILDNDAALVASQLGFAVAVP